MSMLTLIGIAFTFLAILHEQEATHWLSKYACQGKKLTIQCHGTGMKIAVKSAMFGRKTYRVCWKMHAYLWSTTCEAPKSTFIVKSICDGKASCSLYATYSVFEGDPCEFTEKYLEVKYACKAAKQPVITRRTCQYNDINIICTGRKRIKIEDALYGRKDSKICHKWYSYFWSTNCKAKDSLKVVKNICEGKKECKVMARDSVFGDPCPWTEKYLEVKYSCK